MDEMDRLEVLSNKHVCELVAVSAHRTLQRLPDCIINAGDVLKSL